MKAGREDLEVRLENNLLILKTRGSLWDGGTGEKGEISIITSGGMQKRCSLISLRQIITLLLINRTGTVLSPWYVMRDMSSVLIRNGKTC